MLKEGGILKRRYCTTEWASEQDAIALLKDERHDWQKQIQLRRENNFAWQEIVHRCAAANTFRGIRKQSSPPSKRFREWAARPDTRSEFEFLIRRQGQSSFDVAHHALVNRLMIAWEEALTYGQAAKLINLAVRFAFENQFVIESVFNRNVNYIHVPLDQCVLKAIRRCIAAAPYDIKIGSRPSMSSVENAETYVAIQEYLRHLAQQADVAPIVVDYVAWDRTHMA